MSFPPGTFYVYVEHNRDQYLVAFTSRSAADELWRVIQTTNDMENNTRRHSSQHWSVSLLPHEIQGSGTGPAGCFVVQRILADSLDNIGFPVIPHNHQPDNISGNSYFIRSTIRNNLYWFWNQKSNRIELSSTHQTKFLIKRKTPLPFGCLTHQDILIGTDAVHLFPVQDDVDESRFRMITRIGRLGEAKKILFVETQRAESYKNGAFWFRLFDGGFGVQYSSEASGGRVGFVHVATRSDGGERWEFVP
ncbi:hypothetical protein NP233_g9682 [Leucocoprinus birnbaumii]|uniref:Uncharacterized protein n=1 Tax=Leucocoprinus birnbaumii TaxID=56174 RepID=A0AAD5YSL9_9AGAR|nr:hypothetical protein NP233_g9682 [Leucocoprinus birnbaumii]